jgi:hypothetical protein
MSYLVFGRECNKTKHKDKNMLQSSVVEVILFDLEALVELIRCGELWFTLIIGCDYK